MSAYFDQKAAIVARGADADTLRFRALEDRRGTVILNAGKIVLRWSVAGRTDQLNIHENERLVFTGSAHRCMDKIITLYYDK